MRTLETKSFTIKASDSLSRISIDFTCEPIALENVLSLNSTLPNHTRNKFSLLKKITALGYLMAEPVVGEERKIILFHDDEAAVEGRNGKTNIASLLKSFTLSHRAQFFDYFWLDGVTPEVRLLIIEDPIKHTDKILDNLKGDWCIKGKGLPKLIIPKDETPKVLITTSRIEYCYISTEIVRIPFTGIFNDELKQANALMTEESKSRRSEYQQFLDDCVAAYNHFGLINYNF